MPEASGHNAKSLMRKVFCIDSEATVADAAKLMKKWNIGSVFVGETPKPIGIFTERDVVRRVVAEGIDPFKTPVKEVCTKKLITVTSDAPLAKVFECLAKGHFRHLPIADDGDIVGIVSITDLFNILKEMYSDEEFLKDFAGNI